MRSVAAVQDSLRSDQASRWIETELGLHFPPAQWADLQRRLARVAQRLGYDDANACIEDLVARRPSPAERQALAEFLAVGETYFFRDQALFEQLGQQVLRPLIAARRGASRTLRLWSAGCSTGEEAWSLAMLVAGLLPDWRDWEVSILATDLNTAALEKARAGDYGAWSLRGAFPAAAVPYLVPAGSGRYQVTSDIRALVRFAPLNLAVAGEVAAIARGMDLILCRNVLMYFEPTRRGCVLQRLGRALADGGWLVTNPVEIPSSGSDGLALAMFPGLVALRRNARVATAAPQLRTPVPPLPGSGLAAFGAAVPPAPAGREQAGAGPDPRVQPEAPPFDDAEARCRDAIEQDKLNPEWTYRLSCILSERGDLDGSIAALQRTLYLAPDHVLARFALGSLAARRGEQTASRRHFLLALARLDQYGPDAVIEGSGGLTARELAGVIRQFAGAAAC